MSLIRSSDNESLYTKNSIVIYNQTKDYSLQDGASTVNSHSMNSDRLLSLAYGVLQEEGVIEHAPGPLYMAIWMVDDYYIAELNEEFMNHIGTTDVLSFPVDGRPPDRSLTPSPRPLLPPVIKPYSNVIPWVLGDIFICPHQAELNAREHGVESDDEIALLLTHGILHLLGMDHELDAEAEIMEALEQELLRKFWYTPFTSRHETSRQ